jgi:hypothetical protein
MASKRKSETKEHEERFGEKAILARLAMSHALVPQATRWAVDAQRLQQESEEKSLTELTRQQRRSLRKKKARLEVRKLRLLKYDEEFIRELLATKGQLSGVTGAWGTTDADELMWFMCDELALTPVLGALRPPSETNAPKTGKRIASRTMYPPLVINLLSIISRHQGLQGGAEIQAALLVDVRWMRLFGFNLQEVKEGACRRGLGMAGKTRDADRKFVDAGDVGPVRAKIKGPRGALSSQTIAGHESNLPPEMVAATFNAVVRRLAEKGYYPERVRTSLDSTNDEVPPSFEGGGWTKRKVKVQSRARRPRKVEVRIYGFKFWFIMDVETGLPLAMMMDTIEKPECEHARQLVEQAQKNLEGYARIVSVALDRGFLDGDFLYWLKHERGIDWVCPAKEKMQVTREARNRVSEALLNRRQMVEGPSGMRWEDPLETARRLAGRGTPSDGVSFYERIVREGSETLVVANVGDLTCTDFYGPGGSRSSRVNSKKFRPTTLYGTVVLNWPDRPSRDREDEAEQDDDALSAKGPIVLLSPVAEEGFVRFDRYDQRSLIENRLNRDGKQYFQLGQALARNPNALWSASVASALALMLYRAFRIHEDEAEEAMDRRAEELGVVRYRRQTALLNANMVIITSEDRYARLSLEEVLALLGANLA